MSVQNSQVQVGAIFITANGQLRKVTQITTDEQSRIQVHYSSKSANIKDREFSFGHTKANPPLMASFILDCERLLSPIEISQLRQDNIILPHE